MPNTAVHVCINVTFNIAYPRRTAFRLSRVTDRNNFGLASFLQPMPEVHNDGTTCIKNKVVSRICLERVMPLVGYVCICVAMGPGRAHSRPSLGLGDVSHFFSLISQTTVGIPESTIRRPLRASEFRSPLSFLLLVLRLNRMPADAKNHQKHALHGFFTRVMIDQDGKDEPISAYDMVSILHAFY